jgi:transposase
MAGYDLATAAKATGFQARDAKKWLDRFDTTGDVVDATRPGRPRIPMTKQAKERMTTLAQKERIGGTSNKVAKRLHDEGQATLAPRTVRRRLNEEGLQFQPMRPVPKITPSIASKRLAWAYEHARMKWKTVSFSDSKVFYGAKTQASVRKQKCWARQGQPHIVPVPKHAPFKVHVYGAITRSGATQLHFVTGTTNQPSLHKYKTGKQRGQVHRGVGGEEYKSLLLGGWVDEVACIMHLAGIAKWRWQQDLPSIHRGALGVLQGLGELGVVALILDWPSNSPDLNLIEHVWARMEQLLWNEEKYAWEENLESFKEQVKNVWRDVTEDVVYLHALFDGMADRVQNLIQMKGWGPVK